MLASKAKQASVLENSVFNLTKASLKDTVLLFSKIKDFSKEYCFDHRIFCFSANLNGNYSAQTSARLS